MEYWEQMKNKKVPLDAAAYTSLIAAHSDSNLLHNALQYFREFLATKQQPTPEMFACVIVINGKLRNIAAMERLYHRATSQSKRLAKSLSMMLLDALITGYSYGGEWEKAHIIWERLRSQNKKVSKLTSSNLSLDPQPIRPDIFMQVGSNFTLETFGVDTVTICVILDALGKAQQLDKVRQVWKDIRDSNMPLVLNNITSYVEALLRCEQYDEALTIVLALENDFGIRPDKKLLLNTATLMSRDRYHSTVDLLRQRFPDIQPQYPAEIRQSKKPKMNSTSKDGISVPQLEKHLRFKNEIR